MSIKNIEFGYPPSCDLCNFGESKIELKVSPYYNKNGNAFKLMLVGQDPTIYKKPERVKEVLMLDEEKSQIRRWLKSIFHDNFQHVTIYATNLVKCTFDKPPTLYGGLSFLRKYFEKCQHHLQKEILSFKPNLLMSLGEPSHKLIREIFDNCDDVGKTMQDDFDGKFVKARIGKVEFDYTPCLHIKTFRVAEVYGKSVETFKNSITSYFKKL